MRSVVWLVALFAGTYGALVSAEPVPARSTRPLVASGTGTEVLLQGRWLSAVPAEVHPLWPSLEGAQWMWIDRVVLSGEPEEGTPRRQFRHRFEIPKTCATAQATLHITADNAYVASVDKKEIGHDGELRSTATDESWRTIEPWTLSLSPGAHELEVIVMSYGSSFQLAMQNPAGLLYRLDLDCP